MDLSFTFLASLILVGAVAAMSLRNLIHCALSLAGTFIGLAGLYLKLGAQFIGFAQVLVYVGAIAVLLLFVILLTRGPSESHQSSASWPAGVLIAIAVFCLLGGAILFSRALPRGGLEAPQVVVRQIGDLLMTRYVLALEVAGLLLTAALLGGVVLALRDRNGPKASGPGEPLAREVAP